MLILIKKFPVVRDEHEDGGDHGHFRDLLRHRHFLLAILAQFMYVGAQVGTWSYLIPVSYTHLDVYKRQARATAIRATRKWGKMVLIGEGGGMQMNPSPDMIHDQKTLYGSWVTSTWLMEELVERLVRWNLHPADIITHRFALNQAADAYSLMASGKCGKVAVCADGELTAMSK